MVPRPHPVDCVCVRCLKRGKAAWASRPLEADVRAILTQGGDPAVSRTSLASRHGVTLDVVDAAITALGGTPRTIHPEHLAHERIVDDHRRAAWRAYLHAVRIDRRP